MLKRKRDSELKLKKLPPLLPKQRPPPRQRGLELKRRWLLLRLKKLGLRKKLPPLLKLRRLDLRKKPPLQKQRKLD